MENYDRTQALIEARRIVGEMAVALRVNESFGHERSRKKSLMLLELSLRGFSRSVASEALNINKGEWDRRILSATTFINHPELYPRENEWWSILVD